MTRQVALDKKKKESIIKKHRRADGDTGSVEVQIALFTEKISSLTEHLKKNKKDNHSRRGLLKMVSKRKKLLDYLKKVDPKKHEATTKKLKLKSS